MRELFLKTGFPSPHILLRISHAQYFAHLAEVEKAS
jgi:hypothetical protein